MQFYTDPSRESEPHSQPDAEAFYCGPAIHSPMVDGPEVGPTEVGHYWRPFLFGPVPKGAPRGPFDSEALAIADARSDREPEPTPVDRHTPGPWEIDDDELATSPAAKEFGLMHAIMGGRDESDSGIVAYVTDTFRSQPGDSHEANARLIAAAPSLLAACELVIARWEKGDLAEAANACSAAIADAQGGAS